MDRLIAAAYGSQLAHVLRMVCGGVGGGRRAVGTVEAEQWFRYLAGGFVRNQRSRRARERRRHGKKKDTCEYLNIRFYSLSLRLCSTAVVFSPKNTLFVNRKSRFQFCGLRSMLEMLLG